MGFEVGAMDGDSAARFGLNFSFYAHLSALKHIITGECVTLYIMPLAIRKC